MLLDCANGATYRVAPEIFRRLGADVDAIAVEPDGRNINEGVRLHAHRARSPSGSTATTWPSPSTATATACWRSTANGEVVDGDELMALAALHLREQRPAAGDGVAVTVMTNYGFHRAMEDAGIEVATTPVGDRYVLAELLQRGWALGGEQSGHIIDTGFVPSGDGIAAALLALEALGGARPRRAPRDGEAAAAAREREGARPRRAGGRRRASGRRSSARRTRSTAGAGCWCVRPGPSRSCA